MENIELRKALEGYLDLLKRNLAAVSLLPIKEADSNIHRGTHTKSAAADKSIAIIHFFIFLHPFPISSAGNQSAPLPLAPSAQHRRTFYQYPAV